MAGERKDGGPAFPTEHVDTGYESQPYVPSPGMSLRDWFAGQALNGIIASSANPAATSVPIPSDAVKSAFAYADAMLAESEKPAHPEMVPATTDNLKKLSETMKLSSGKTGA